MLEMVLEYKDKQKPPKAETVLRAAQHVVKLLRALERERSGKPPVVVWRVNVAMHFSRAVITLDANSNSDGDYAWEIAKSAQGKELTLPGVK